METAIQPGRCIFIEFRPSASLAGGYKLLAKGYRPETSWTQQNKKKVHAEGMATLDTLFNT